ncbi:MAG TPA: response regulator [Smithellaceae bacterium]|jgi:two-component system chemotaxis response regulator CheY|nr:response regulator [Syntrophaceae bacterium]HPV49025.1 response regulator [Smithellaceae bacterium]
MNEKNIKVLIVDDFATMRKVIRNLLKQVGYEDIVEAEDGVMALKALKSQKIDVIVSDWNMPNMTGFELLKAVRADPDLAKTPFLMVTAEALQDNVVAAVKAGVNNYIVKPFTAEVLNEKIKKIMDGINK